MGQDTLNFLLAITQDPKIFKIKNLMILYQITDKDRRIKYTSLILTTNLD